MKIIELKSGYKIIEHLGRYYLYYKMYSRSTSRPWCLVPQPNTGQIMWFESEKELLNFIENENKTTI